MLGFVQIHVQVRLLRNLSGELKQVNNGFTQDSDSGLLGASPGVKLHTLISPLEQEEGLHKHTYKQTQSRQKYNHPRKCNVTIQSRCMGTHILWHRAVCRTTTCGVALA